MLVDKTKEYLSQSLHKNGSELPEEKNLITPVDQHGRHDVTCKPLVTFTLINSLILSNSYLIESRSLLKLIVTCIETTKTSPVVFYINNFVSHWKKVDK